MYAYFSLHFSFPRVSLFCRILKMARITLLVQLRGTIFFFSFFCQWMLPWLLTLSDVKFLNFISENPTVPELKRPVHILLYLRHTFLHISMKSLCYCHFLNNCYLPFAFSIHFYYLWVISDPLWIWYKGLLPLTLQYISYIETGTTEEWCVFPICM